jgi:exo-beta-1,3-glucanase (GH17 family)
VAVALTVAGWAWLGRPVDLPPAPEAKLHCASYTPFRGSQTPFDPTMVIPKAQIEEDLKQLQPVTDCIRTYAVNQGIDQAVPVAAELGMKVLLGIWIGRNPVDNEAQIKTAIELAKAHPETVKAIIVGNEVLLRGEQTGETLAEMAKRIRAESGARVTYADVWEFWLRAPDVLKQSVDFITIHILPYWEDDPLPVAQAVKHLETIVAEVQQKFPGREIVIGETGWPSEGRWREDAAPSIVNQARYLREFLVYAKAHDLDYNFIEAFDQPW